MLANNETGVIQPISKIAEIIREEQMRRLSNGEKTPIYLHSDASQGVGQIDISVARLGVDMLTINAGKIYGPKTKPGFCGQIEKLSLAHKSLAADKNEICVAAPKTFQM